MTIPEGSVANVRIPLTPSQTIEIIRKPNDMKPEEIEGLPSGQFKLEGGAYVLTISPVKS